VKIAKTASIRRQLGVRHASITGVVLVRALAGGLLTRRESRGNGPPETTAPRQGSTLPGHRNRSGTDRKRLRCAELSSRPCCAPHAPLLCPSRPFSVLCRGLLWRPQTDSGVNPTASRPTRMARFTEPRRRDRAARLPPPAPADRTRVAGLIERVFGPSGAGRPGSVRIASAGGKSEGNPARRGCASDPGREPCLRWSWLVVAGPGFEPG